MTERTKRPTPKRRWLRFSLRTFLIVVTILGVSIGWYVYRVEQQRKAVKWILENDGGVGYSYENDFKLPEGFDALDLSPSSHFPSQPPVPEWLLDILDINYFSDIVDVDLSNAKVSDVTPLAGLRNLEYLWLTNTQVSDLTPLADLRNLEQLDLIDTPVSDLTPLSELTNLEVLWLSNTNVSDEEIEKLKLALPNCTISTADSSRLP